MLFLGQSLNDHFNRDYVTHLAFYGITNQDIRVLSGLLILIPNIATAWLLGLLVVKSEIYIYTPILVVLTIVICGILPPVLILRKKRSNSAVRKTNSLGARLLAKRKLAYVFRDIKETTRPSFAFTIVLMIPISLVITVFTHMGFFLEYLFFLAFVIILYPLLFSYFEVEYHEIARYHVRLYRVSNKEIVSAKIKVIIFVAVFLFIVHLVLILCISPQPLEMIMLDFIFLLLTIIVLYCVTWVFAFCLHRGIQLNVIVLTLVMLAVFVFPVGIIAGLLAKRRLRER